MSLLSPAPCLPIAGGQPNRLRIATAAPGRFSGPAPANHRRINQGCYLPPRCALPLIDHSRFSANSAAFDPISFLLDGSITLFTFLRVLPPDCRTRWQQLVELPEEKADAWLARLPIHLIQAVTASEDQRFFSHIGVDPYGIARAVVHFPNGGGGSTITQQLMKRVFLTSERKFSRKFVEGLLSLIVEKRISKKKILYSYLSTMYWGHGKYGVDSASLFYFGKFPASLTVGESAMLAGILPAPEFINPRTNLKRAKSSQAKVLRKMVSAGFIGMETALRIARDPLCLCNTNEEGKKIKTC
ncbi:hypothetical protein AXF42_Ash013057 [Apostasia shenzhenica]|uniref:Glycosyl transferase family 51 domain-containing protein n=1 Tax=Apostasia shenzhenica TaxID=1088818 RepID=A0A2I0BCY0_9ASPA|nr:hypothetical protein AXF42_Ash013057 [Apostasia shenzhenica]